MMRQLVLAVFQMLALVSAIPTDIDLLLVIELKTVIEFHDKTGTVFGSRVGSEFTWIEYITAKTRYTT
jgi:hypothetical protein